MSEILIPGVTNIPSLSMEKAFRQNKTVSVEMKKGPRCKIENMREILKNWFTPNKIPESKMSKKNKSRYRGLVYAYLKDKNTDKCPQAYKALIEEYTPHILNNDLNKELKVNKFKSKNNSLSKPCSKSKVDDKFKHSMQVVKDFSIQLKQAEVTEFRIKFKEFELCVNMI